MKVDLGRFIHKIVLNASKQDQNQLEIRQLMVLHSTTNWLTKSSCVVGLTAKIIEQVSSLFATFFKLYVQFST